MLVKVHLNRRSLLLKTAAGARRIRVPQLSCESKAYSTGSLISCQFISNGLKVAAKCNLFRQGQQLHAHVIKSRNHDNLSLQNYLLSFYVKCKRVPDACNLFDEMLVRDVVSWNTLICGLSGSSRHFRSYFNLGFWYFKMMLMESSTPDWITLTSLLRLCVDMNETELARVLHCLTIMLGFSGNCRVNSALVDTYGKIGLVEEARLVFCYAEERDLVSWNVMLSCYATNNLVEEGLALWSMMRWEGLIGDDFTFTNLLKSCGSFGNSHLGEEIHGIIIKLCFGWDVVLASSLVDMYAKNEKIIEARKAFDEMPFRNVVSWTTMIVGYGQCGKEIEAVKLLNQMLRNDFHPDELTLSSILSSCGSLALLSEISQVHAYAFKNGLSQLLSFANALISAYFKSGSITCASEAFSSVSEPDLVSWTSIIAAYAFHGFPKEATKFFERMLTIGLKPDKIAFLEVLSACNHGGLVNEGLHYYRLMLDVYKIAPDLEHHACLVDLLGRVGLLSEAFDVLTSKPLESGADSLGAFLGACKVHGNVEFANWAVEKLLDLEPNKPVNYSLLSNLYASSGLWSHVAHTRKNMRQNCCNKAPGCSWTHIAGKVFSFVSGDKSHPQHGKVSFLLRLLYRVMKDKDDEFATYYTT